MGQVRFSPHNITWEENDIGWEKTIYYVIDKKEELFMLFHFIHVKSSLHLYYNDTRRKRTIFFIFVLLILYFAGFRSRLPDICIR